MARNTKSDKTVARLAIQLVDVEPEVFRRIEVATNTRLDDLHDIIQAVFGWDDSHLHAFELGRAMEWLPPEAEPCDDGDDGGPTDSITLGEVLALRSGQTRTNKKLTYVYDFGDDWRHAIKVEATLGAKDGTVYPRLVEARGAAPPEDCGGPFGYSELLAAHGDPTHEAHETAVNVFGEAPFDPTVADEEAIRARLALITP